METKIVSFKYYQIEKQYKEFYSNLNNYNYSLKLVGTAPKDIIDFKKVKSG